MASRFRIFARGCRVEQVSRHLICLFYQVEIRYRQLPPKANRPSDRGRPICAEVTCDYGNRMLIRSVGTSLRAGTGDGYDRPAATVTEQAPRARDRLADAG